MNVLFLGTIIVSISIVAVQSTPPDTYYECEQYPGDQWDQIDKTRRECMREEVDGVDLIFCRYWECEKPNCPEEEQLMWGDGCKSCPGSCSEGGKIRAEGTSFTCVDRTNTCTCAVGGGLSTTYMGYLLPWFCNVPIDQ